MCRGPALRGRWSDLWGRRCGKNLFIFLFPPPSDMALFTDARVSGAAAAQGFVVALPDSAWAARRARGPGREHVPAEGDDADDEAMDIDGDAGDGGGGGDDDAGMGTFLQERDMEAIEQERVAELILPMRGDGDPAILGRAKGLTQNHGVFMEGEPGRRDTLVFVPLVNVADASTGRRLRATEERASGDVPSPCPPLAVTGPTLSEAHRHRCRLYTTVDESTLSDPCVAALSARLAAALVTHETAIQDATLPVPERQLPGALARYEAGEEGGSVLCTLLPRRSSAECLALRLALLWLPPGMLEQLAVQIQQRDPSDARYLGVGGGYRRLQVDMHDGCQQPWRLFYAAYVSATNPPPLDGAPPSPHDLVWWLIGQTALADLASMPLTTDGRLREDSVTTLLWLYMQEQQRWKAVAVAALAAERTIVGRASPEGAELVRSGILADLVRALATDPCPLPDAEARRQVEARLFLMFARALVAAHVAESPAQQALADYRDHARAVTVENQRMMEADGARPDQLVAVPDIGRAADDPTAAPPGLDHLPRGPGRRLSAALLSRIDHLAALARPTTCGPMPPVDGNWLLARGGDDADDLRGKDNIAWSRERAHMLSEAGAQGALSMPLAYGEWRLFE